MSLVAGRLAGLGLVIFRVALGEVRCLVSLAEKQVGSADSCPLFQVMLGEQEVCIRYSFSGRKKGNPFHFVNRPFHSHHTHQRSRRYRKSEKSGKEKEEASRWDLQGGGGGGRAKEEERSKWRGARIRRWERAGGWQPRRWGRR